jgi:hypothetical protein
VVFAEPASHLDDDRALLASPDLDLLAGWRHCGRHHPPLFHRDNEFRD